MSDRTDDNPARGVARQALKVVSLRSPHTGRLKVKHILVSQALALKSQVIKLNEHNIIFRFDQDE